MRFAADKRSIKRLLEYGNNINPWAIDKDTGVSKSNNPELFNKKWNMLYVDALMDIL